MRNVGVRWLSQNTLPASLTRPKAGGRFKNTWQHTKLPCSFVCSTFVLVVWRHHCSRIHFTRLLVVRPIRVASHQPVSARCMWRLWSRHEMHKREFRPWSANATALPALPFVHSCSYARQLLSQFPPRVIGEGNHGFLPRVIRRRLFVLNPHRLFFRVVA